MPRHPRTAFERALSQPLVLALALWFTLFSPPVRALLEATMVRHMLVQMPLLVYAGWLLAAALPASARRSIARWNAGGVAGLVLASMASMPWMVPLALDAALDTPLGLWAKFLTLPLLIGLPLRLSWPQAGFVVRGLFMVEVIATVWRTGWLYLVSPVRLCTNYSSDQQLILGQGLVAIGAAIFLWIVLHLFIGHPGRAPRH